MSRADIWKTIHSERRALAAILRTLTADEWAADSLCGGWTIKDVAAHVIANPQMTVADAWGIIPARGNYDRFVFEHGRRAGRRSVEEILADFGRYDGSQRKPPAVPVRFPLIEILVHTQDIVLPLGRAHAMPVDAAAVAISLSYRLRRRFGTHRRLAGVRLIAADTRWSAGNGLPVTGPIQQLLLVITGRPVDSSQLSGPGVMRLDPAVG